MALHILKLQKNSKIYRTLSLVLKEEKNGTLSEKIYAANSHTWVNLRRYYHHGMISSTIRVQACTRGMLTRKVLRKGKTLLAQVNFTNKSEEAVQLTKSKQGFEVFWYVFLEEKKIHSEGFKRKACTHEQFEDKFDIKVSANRKGAGKRQSRAVHRLYSGLIEAHFGKRNARRSINYSDF